MVNLGGGLPEKRMFAKLARWKPRLFGRPSNRRLIDRLHGEIVAAARNRVLFSDFGIEDTFEGRFESVVLHAALVLRRLRALPDPGPDMAQDLADALFRNFEVALREIGVGDSNVPKRMKAMAEAFLGRGLAYDEALREDKADLEAALKRNVYAGRKDARQLAAYVLLAEAALAEAGIEAFTMGPVPFPETSVILAEAIA
jgi:cytochrome b pre-mRNA-processing protein 3